MNERIIHTEITKSQNVHVDVERSVLTDMSLAYDVQVFEVNETKRVTVARCSTELMATTLAMSLVQLLDDAEGC